MRAKGLRDEDIDDALKGFDDEQQAKAATEALKKLMPRYAGLDRRAARGKLSAALARRGFRYDSIQAAFDALASDDDAF
jgi:SOS response regulatory protein OraA/RecX